MNGAKRKQTNNGKGAAKGRDGIESRKFDPMQQQKMTLTPQLSQRQEPTERATKLTHCQSTLLTLISADQKWEEKT
jgi:hypothetical protein